jgi:hypothetical protein
LSVRVKNLKGGVPLSFFREYICGVIIRLLRMTPAVLYGQLKRMLRRRAR